MTVLEILLIIAFAVPAAFFGVVFVVCLGVTMYCGIVAIGVVLAFLAGAIWSMLKDIGRFARWVVS